MTVLLLFYDVKVDDVCLWPLLRFVNCKLSGLCTIHLYKTMYSGNIFFSNEAMRTFQFHLLNWLLLAFRLVLIQRFTFFFQRALSMITHCLQRNVESTAICVRWVRLCLSIIVTLMKIRPHFMGNLCRNPHNFKVFTNVLFCCMFLLLHDVYFFSRKRFNSVYTKLLKF